jgi:hypothetical protein
MIAKLKSFLNPATQEAMYRRIIGVLIACIAIVFVALLLSLYQDVRTSVYLSDGETVLKLSADNTVTIYKSR